MLELMVEPEEQQKGLSSITADTTAQAIVDGGVSVAVVDEKVIQQDTKHHGNIVKLEVWLARAETHRRELATVKRARWHCGHPRGRRAMRSVSR